MTSKQSRSIRGTLFNLGDAIDQSAGSRVLWIDDHPEEIIGERRVLRALGVLVVSTNSSKSARAILEQDNDFDLIVSDLQRPSEPRSRFKRYGGIEFIKELRE